MKEQLTKALIGGTGITASYITEQAATLNPAQITEVGSLVVQIIIGIVTLFGLLKRKNR